METGAGRATRTPCKIVRETAATTTTARVQSPVDGAAGAAGNNFLSDIGDMGRPRDAHPLQDSQGAYGDVEDCEVRWTVRYATDAVLRAPGAAAAPTLPEIRGSYTIKT